jgi:hypothetical protein
MLNDPNCDVKPDIKYVKIDETRHWNPDFLAKYGIERMVAVYVYDANTYTYCCELTPSHWLEFIETQPETKEWLEDNEVREEMYDAIMEAQFQCDNDCYMHVHAVAEGRANIIEVGSLEGCEDLEEGREYAQGNSL